MAEPGPASVGFDFIDRRVMAAVERVASNDPNPADPFRGLYISDDRALELSRGESVSDADDRLAHVDARARARPARRRRAGDLRGARAEPALRPPVRVPAGRRDAQAPEPAARRAPARRRRRLGRRRDDGVRAHRAAAGQAARSGSRATRRRRSPSARSSSSDRLAAHLLGVGMDDPPRRRQAPDGPAPRPRPGPRRGRRRARRHAPAPEHAARRAGRPGRRGARRQGATAARSWSPTSARSTAPTRWPRRR